MAELASSSSSSSSSTGAAAAAPPPAAPPGAPQPASASAADPAADPQPVLAPGAWVTVHSLASAAGQRLNGRVAQVAARRRPVGLDGADADGRVAVYVDDVDDGASVGGRVVALRPANLRLVPAGATRPVVRLLCRGEEVELGRTKIVGEQVPLAHSVFQRTSGDGGGSDDDDDGGGNSALMAKAGFPLIVRRFSPLVVPAAMRGAGADSRANKLARFLVAADPATGKSLKGAAANLAPMGPCIVFRPAAGAVTSEDVHLAEQHLWDIWHWTVLVSEQFEDRDADHSQVVTPESFARQMRDLQADRARHGNPPDSFNSNVNTA
jgi:hypothetical protein